MNILLELYDRHNIENIIALLRGKYDKVIYFVGTDIPGEGERAFLREFVMNHFGTPAVFAELPQKSVREIASAISSYIESNNKYTLELTGGTEEYCAACGYVALSRDNIDICKYDISSDDAGIVQPLTFRDFVALGGGAQLSVTDVSKEKYAGNDFTNSVIYLWDAVKNISPDWNRFCSLPASSLPSGGLSRKISKKTEKLSCERVLRELKKHRLVRDYSVECQNDKGSAVYYLSSSVKYSFLYDKSGTILEHYACLAAVKSGLFRDCGVGAILDLNGIISDSPAEPRNELDLTMCSGAVPYFVSCKNCQPTKEFLYEIKAIADHFKGVYAIPALISSLPANTAVRNRASEMGIYLIDNVSSMTLKQLSEKIGELRKIR